MTVKPQISEFEQQIDAGDEIYIFLEKINYHQYYSKFKMLGCDTLEDILLLNEKDFYANEIPLIHIRKILKKAKFYLESHLEEEVDL